MTNLSSPDPLNRQEQIDEQALKIEEVSLLLTVTGTDCVLLKDAAKKAGIELNSFARLLMLDGLKQYRTEQLVKAARRERNAIPPISF